jgi:hypothetical protein
MVHKLWQSLQAAAVRAVTSGASWRAERHGRPDASGGQGGHGGRSLREPGVLAEPGSLSMASVSSFAITCSSTCRGRSQPTSAKRLAWPREYSTLAATKHHGPSDSCSWQCASSRLIATKASCCFRFAVLWHKSGAICATMSQAQKPWPTGICVSEQLPKTPA